MKNINLLSIIMVFSLLVISCGEDCEKTTFEEVILGTWNTTDQSGPDAEKVTFNADGTGFATENSLFTSESNGIPTNEFTWTYDEESMDLNIRWQHTPMSSTNVDYEIKSFDCDEILMNWILDVIISK